MKKARRKTDAYLNYTFPDDSYNDLPPGWLDDVDIMLALKDEIFGKDKKVIQPIVYTFYDKSKHPLYVGKSMCFDNRIKQHCRLKENKEPWMNDVAYVGLIPLGDLYDMDIIEMIEIAKKCPLHSNDLNHDGDEYITPLGIGPSLEIKIFYEENVFPFKRLFDSTGTGNWENDWLTQSQEEEIS